MAKGSSYRGRLAPSPTGYLHLGHARTFWVAWRRARAAHGRLIFRNEDLDYQRCKPEFVKAMYEDLRWLGLDWDEGPDITPQSGKSGQPGDPDPKSGSEVKYRDVRFQDELQLSVYNFEKADVEKAWKHLEMYEAESQALINGFTALAANKTATVAEKERFPLLAAYELCLKCSHLFNILDARGAISVTERVGVIARIRQLAVGLAKAYVAQQNAAAAEVSKQTAAKQQKGGAA